MEGKTFYVIDVMDIETGKCYAYAETIHNCYNLIGFMEGTKDKKVLSMNACKTLKEAKRISDQWNEGYKQKGILFW